MSLLTNTLPTHTLLCLGCGNSISAADAPPDFRCVHCASLFDVVYPARDVQQAKQWPSLWLARRSNFSAIDQSGVWRYRELLPILNDLANAVTLREGNTPVYELPRSAEWAGVDHLLAKHQGINPTGSFKDTGMSAAISVAKERGFTWVACASTGNTSAAMAAYAASAGMRSLVLLPEGKISWSKLSQAIDSGALTCQLKTDFDGCVRVLNELIREAPIYLLNSVNPYRIEGQKTPAIELMEQMDWQVPNHILVPGGNLANSSALGKAFLDLHEVGLISRLPRISILQAEGANALVRSMRENGGRSLLPVRAETRASAIRIGNPASWQRAVHILAATGGMCEQVSEAEIALAKALIGSEGIGCEPASAVTLAGLRKFVVQGKITRGESVVLLLTGHTLKDPDYTLAFHQGTLLNEQERASLNEKDRAIFEKLRQLPRVLEPSCEAVRRELEKEMGQRVAR